GSLHRRHSRRLRPRRLVARQNRLADRDQRVSWGGDRPQRAGVELRADLQRRRDVRPHGDRRGGRDPMVVRVRRVTASADLTVGRTVDGGFPATVGQRLARPGPPSTDYTRRQVVVNLATAAKAAEPPVREVTGLRTDGAVPEARIIDRPGGIRAAAESMGTMTGGTEKPRGAISGRLTGAQTGAVLAFVSSCILGQYDPFSDGGVLLLVYPNVIAVERQLRVEPSDFRLWVCLHEVTHRVQFTANPWLSGYMSQALGVLTQESSDDVAQVLGRLADFVRSRGDSLAGPDAHSTGVLGLLRAVQSEPQ